MMARAAGGAPGAMLRGDCSWPGGGAGGEGGVRGVKQDDGEVGGGRAGDHVAGVLLVARGVGDDEAAAGRGEVPVGHVDGDALLALGLEAVGEEDRKSV